MATFYAQPYDISVTGFYFETVEEYEAKQKACRNDDGQSVEEFEIQLIEAENIDISLFEALYVSQENVGYFIDKIEEWYDHEKYLLIIAVGECGYRFNLAKDTPDKYDIFIYEVDSLEELAEQFIEDGLYGTVPEALQYYIDYRAISRDLSVDFSMAKINGTRLAYQCY